MVAPGEGSREPWSRALRTPLDRVLPLGTPRTDRFYDTAALDASRSWLLAIHPELRGKQVVAVRADVPRPGSRRSVGTSALDGTRLRERLPAEYALVLKSHPNLDPATQPTAGFDVVADPKGDMNDWLALADVFVTDYSSSIFEWAILHRPLVLLVDDLEAYEQDPGMYLDYRTEMIGTQVTTPTASRTRSSRPASTCRGYDRSSRPPSTPATATPRSDSSTGSCPATKRPLTAGPDAPTGHTLDPWPRRSSSTSTPGPTTPSPS